MVAEHGSDPSAGTVFQPPGGQQQQQQQQQQTGVHGPLLGPFNPQGTSSPASWATGFCDVEGFLGDLQQRVSGWCDEMRSWTAKADTCIQAAEVQMEGQKCQIQEIKVVIEKLNSNTQQNIEEQESIVHIGSQTQEELTNSQTGVQQAFADQRIQLGNLRRDATECMALPLRSLIKLKPIYMGFVGKPR